MNNGNEKNNVIKFPPEIFDSYLQCLEYVQELSQGL